MAGTFSQIYIQLIFGVQYRQQLIAKEWEEQLYQYISGLVRNKGQKMIAINGVSDHIHLLIGIRPSCCISDLVREIKKSSTQFINQKGFTSEPFKWQGGFGAFSYSRTSLDRVYHYIKNQKAHHRKVTFEEEYKEFLRKFEVDFNEDYLFDNQG